jgi:Matrixin
MRFTASLLFMLASLSATHAHAAERLMTADGQALSWPKGKQITLYVDATNSPTDGATLMKILNQAFGVWSDAAQDAPRATSTLQAAPAGENRSHRVQVIKDDWLYDDTTLAVTTYTYSKKSGELVDADIVINGSGPCFATGDKLPSHCYDLLGVLTHEAGHFLGLDHNGQEPEAIMFPSLAAGDTSKRELSDDDRQGIALTYGDAPVKAATSSTNTHKGSTSSAQSAASDDLDPYLMPGRAGSCAQSDASGMGLWLFALGLPMLVRRRAKAGALALVTVLAMPLLCEASSHVRGTKADMDSLIVGRASKGHSYVDPALGLVVTEYTIETVACLGGKCEPQGRFITLGGEVNGLVTRVAGISAPKADETFVFNTAAPQQGVWKRIDETSLPLDLLYTLEARGLLARAKRLGR